MAMNCETFKQNLDAFLDGELTDGERQAMEEHADGCGSCARLLEQAIDLSDMCAEMNEDLFVPLEAQAAWRQAVRAEAKSKKRAMNGWMRGIAGAAAAMAVLIAGTHGVRISGSVPAGTEPAIIMAAESDYTPDYEQDAERRGVDAVSGSGYVLTGVGLQSDGSVSGQRSVTTEDASAKETPVILRSAARSIQSDSYDSDIQWLQDLVSEYGAYFEERSETAASEDGVTGRVASAVVRVPSERLDDFLMELDQLGETAVRSESAEDVTGRYMDTQSRLDALKMQKQKLDEMLAAAANVEELIAIDDKMTEVIASMETLEGDLRRWESQQSYSRVTLTLTEMLKKPVETAASLGQRMKDGFDESVVWLKEFGQDALVTLAAAAPRLVIWIPGLALVIVALCAIRGKMRGK